MMRDFFKLAELNIYGLFTALIAYPLLHESGHIISAALLDADITEFKIFPIPYVCCEISTLSDIKIILISISGIIFPFLIATTLKPKSFRLWFINTLTKGICLYSFLLSAASVVMFKSGYPIPNDDITQILHLNPPLGILFVGFIILICISFKHIVKERPLLRIYKHFNIATAQKNKAEL